MSLTSLRKARVVDLYRRSLREIPRTINVFDMDMPEAEVRTKVRALFRKHDGVKDPRVIDHLLMKGENDLQETVEVWKQRAHLYRLLGYDTTLKPEIAEHKGESPFLKKFYGEE